MYSTQTVRGNSRTKTVRGLATSTLTLAAACLSAHGQISFSETIDFAGYQHGSIVEPGDYSGFQYVSPQINVTPPPGGFDKVVTFDTQDPNVPGNPVVEDQDLIPNGTGNRGNANYGNIAIIQENTNFTVTNGRIDNPYATVDDHANGGTFTFDLNPAAGVTVDSFRIDLIDVETPGQLMVVAYDANGSFTWTGSDLQALDPSIMYGNASANRSPLLTASAAGLAGITRVDFISNTSFAIDNFQINGTVVPEPTSGLLAILSTALLCCRRQRRK